LKWFAVVNPLAGAGSAGSKWDNVRKALFDEGLSFDYGITTGPETTRSITRRAVLSGYGGIAVFGGDGTLSDTASVLSGNPDVVLAVIPGGSGNDWARSMGFSSTDIKGSVSAMAHERSRSVDTALARCNGIERFFLNSSGTGFDALVLKRAISLRKHLPLNKTCYAVSLLYSALRPPGWQAEFSCDGEVFHKGSYLTFTAGVGCYSGGGMRLSPAAVPDDGKLDGLCLTPMNFLTISSNLKRVFDGRLDETKWARNCRGEVIRLRPIADSELLLELDGEPVDLQGATALELVSVPESLRVISP